MAFTIAPSLDSTGTVLTWSPGDLNKLLHTEVYDLSDPYQKLLKPYHYMTVNSKGKFVINYLESTDVIFQPAKSCFITPMGEIVSNQKTLEPCPMEAATIFCQDELFGSCYDVLLRWRDGKIEEGEALALLSEITSKFAVSVTRGMKMNLVMGKFYPSIDYTAAPTTQVSTTAYDAFVIASNVCQGWVQLLVTIAANGTCPQANIATAMTAADWSGNEFIGSSLDIFDNLVAGADPNLQNVLVNASNPALLIQGITPIILVDPALYRGISKEYRAQCENPACINKRLGQMIETVNGRPFKILTIDDIPIMPVSQVSEWDKYTTGNTHLMVVTMSGIIQLGSSFDSLDSGSNYAETESAVTVWKDPDPFHSGQYKMRSSALAVTGIADCSYLSGVIIHVKPA